MRFSVNFVAAFALAATFAAATTVSASAECKRYGFTVNDYGKDGPTKDAKDLLDKLIASKMTEKGVSDFHTGKKSVSCELFLNFIVFDEHTCTAEATVCWGGSSLPSSEEAAASAAEPASKTASDTSTDAKPAKKKATKEAAVHTEAVVHTDAAAPAVHKIAAQPIPDPKSVLAHKAKKTEEKKEAAAPAADSSTDSPSTDSAAKPVETGSLSETTTKPAKHKSQKSADGSAAVAPIKEKSDDAGYPSPLPPSDGATDGPAQ
jgi:flagellar hook-length control protein FliK